MNKTKLARHRETDGGSKHIVARSILVPALFLISAGCTDASRMGAEFSEITEETSRIVFNGPDLEDAYKKILYSQSNGNAIQRTVASYAARNGAHPRAEMILLETDDDHYLYEWKVDTPSEMAVGISNNQGKPWKRLESGRMDGYSYIIGRLDEVACILFRRLDDLVQQGGASDYRTIISGYYCGEAISDMTEKSARSILSDIYVRP